MQIRTMLVTLFVLLFATSPAMATVIGFTLGLNTFSGSIEDDQVYGELYLLREEYQIDWIEIIVTNHVDSAVDRTNIDYLFEDQTSSDPLYVSKLDLSGSITGDGTHSILDAPFTGEPFSTINFTIFYFSTEHTGETVNASSDIEWRVSVSEVPEPSSLALLGFGGLALLRRRRVAVA